MECQKRKNKEWVQQLQELNQIIEKSKLDFLNQKEQKPDEKNKIKFIDYSINIIDKQYVKIATKKKFLSSLRFFQRFLKETISMEDIPISEPNQNLFQNFYNYIIQNKIKAETEPPVPTSFNFPTATEKPPKKLIKVRASFSVGMCHPAGHISRISQTAYLK